MPEHRTQLYLSNAQYRWLKRHAERSGSIAAVVRDLIDRARGAEGGAAEDDPFISYLLDEPAVGAKRRSTVEDLDRDLYGA